MGHAANTYTNFLGIDVTAINKQLQKAEDIYEAAIEFLNKRGGEAEAYFNSTNSYIFNQNGDDFAGGVRDRIYDYIAETVISSRKNRETNEELEIDFTSLFIEASLDELALLTDEDFYIDLGIKTQQTSVVNHESKIIMEDRVIESAEDFTALAEEKYEEKFAELYKVFAHEHEEYKDDTEFLEYFDKNISDIVSFLADNFYYDDNDFNNQFAIALKQNRIEDNEDCEYLVCALEKDLADNKQVYEREKEKEKSQKGKQSKTKTDDLKRG